MAEPEKKSTLTEVSDLSQVINRSLIIFNSKLNPPPDYIDHRIKIWEELKVKYQEFLASQTPVDITITLPDGKQLPGKSWRTTPNEIAQGIRSLHSR